MTALMHAICSYQYDCVKLILRHAKSTGHLNPAQRTNRGNTALHFAYETGDDKFVRLLNKYGYGTVSHVKNIDGRTPKQCQYRR